MISFESLGYILNYLKVFINWFGLTLYTLRYIYPFLETPNHLFHHTMVTCATSLWPKSITKPLKIVEVLDLVGSSGLWALVFESSFCFVFFLLLSMRGLVGKIMVLLVFLFEHLLWDKMLQQKYLLPLLRKWVSAFVEVRTPSVAEQRGLSCAFEMVNPLKIGNYLHTGKTCVEGDFSLWRF